MMKSNRLRQYIAPHLLVGCFTAAVLLVIVLINARTGIKAESVDDLVLNCLILVFTAWTLILTIPEPAKLWIGRQEELGYSDVLFHIERDSPQGIPVSIGIQLHVIVSNVGGRKTVLSKLALVDFLDANELPVDLGVHGLRAEQYVVLHRWQDTRRVLEGQEANLQRFSFRDSYPGPFTLNPDDALSLRFKVKAGINWSPHWTIEKLQTLGEQLGRPICFARLDATYRRADELIVDQFTVPVVVEQQMMYLQALRFQTEEFSIRPTIAERMIPPELE